MTETTKLKLAALALLAAVLQPASSLSATIYADARADWDAARTNGLGIVGTDDSPEQGHPDTVGSGAWYYYAGSSYALFTGGTTPMTWVAGTGQYRWSNLFGINRTALSPPNGAGGSSSNRPVSQRIWESGVSGTVTVEGNFTNISGPGTGVDVAVVVARQGASNLMPVDTSFVAEGSESLDFAFDAEVMPGDLVAFLIGPNGNHFNDGVLFDATISAIPEPAASTWLALVLPLGLAVRRRRR